MLLNYQTGAPNRRLGFFKKAANKVKGWFSKNKKSSHPPKSKSSKHSKSDKEEEKLDMNQFNSFHNKSSELLGKLYNPDIVNYYYNPFAKIVQKIANGTIQYSNDHFGQIVKNKGEPVSYSLVLDNGFKEPLSKFLYYYNGKYYIRNGDYILMEDSKVICSTQSGSSCVVNPIMLECNNSSNNINKYFTGGNYSFYNPHTRSVDFQIGNEILLPNIPETKPIIQTKNGFEIKFTNTYNLPLGHFLYYYQDRFYLRDQDLVYLEGKTICCKANGTSCDQTKMDYYTKICNSSSKYIDSIFNFGEYTYYDPDEKAFV